jgi:hypothetical protein
MSEDCCPRTVVPSSRDSGPAADRATLSRLRRPPIAATPPERRIGFPGPTSGGAHRRGYPGDAAGVAVRSGKAGRCGWCRDSAAIAPAASTRTTTSRHGSNDAPLDAAPHLERPLAIGGVGADDRAPRDPLLGQGHEHNGGRCYRDVGRCKRSSLTPACDARPGGRAERAPTIRSTDAREPDGHSRTRFARTIRSARIQSLWTTTTSVSAGRAFSAGLGSVSAP